MRSYEIENTPKFIELIMSEQLQLSDDNIAWRFNSCPRFALAFKAKYPNFTKETYLRQAVELLQESGLTFKIRCFTDNRKSKYSCLYSIEMYINGEWEWESETLHESNVFIYWVNDAIELFDRLNRLKR
jgi:hypothetical protein